MKSFLFKYHHPFAVLETWVWFSWAAEYKWGKHEDESTLNSPLWEMKYLDYEQNVSLIKTTLNVDSTLDEIRFQSDAIPLNWFWRRKEIWVWDYKVKLFSDTRKFQKNALRLFRMEWELGNFFFSITHSWDLAITHLKSKIKAITPSFWKKTAAKVENVCKLVSSEVCLPSYSNNAEMIGFLDCIFKMSNIFASCIKIVRNKSLLTDSCEIMMRVTNCK